MQVFHRAPGWLLLSIIVCASGCGGPVYRGPNVSQNIIGVYALYTIKPWLSFANPPTNIPDGLKFTLYLTSAGSNLGVFGDGVIHIEMYRVDTDSAGVEKRIPIRQWSFTTEQAYPFRAKTAHRLGYAYSFRLCWSDADVQGKEIMIIPTFERRDGKVIGGQPKYMKVPLKV